MSAPLDELYLGWLYRLIADPETANPSQTYWNLANELYRTRFVWFVPNDDNRVEDGRYLRHEFCEDLGLRDVDPAWMRLDCSMLEMIIGLSRRLSFLGDGEPRDWFWEMIDNVDLRISDRRRRFPKSFVQEVLNDVIWRLYEPNGRGGLFPLRRPDRDQREVELFRQLSAYLREH